MFLDVYMVLCNATIDPWHFPNIPLSPMKNKVLMFLDVFSMLLDIPWFLPNISLMIFVSINSPYCCLIPSLSLWGFPNVLSPPKLFFPYIHQCHPTILPLFFKLKWDVLNHGIWQPSYYQGKKLSNKERNKK